MAARSAGSGGDVVTRPDSRDAPHLFGLGLKEMLADEWMRRKWIDGTLQSVHMTTALWGVGSTAPYGHDGRSINLSEVILRRGGEAQKARDAFAAATSGDRTATGFPQLRHGAIKLTVLFNDPTDVE